MTFEQAIDILASEPLILESKLPRTAEEWKEISEIWLKKRDEQIKFLQDNPQWIGRPAELSTKKLITKYDGYYKQALKKARDLENRRKASEEWWERNYDFVNNRWR
jgi:hypothetical protein